MLPRLRALDGSALGFGTGLLATTLVVLLGATRFPTVGLVLVLAVVLGVAAVTTVPGATLVAAQCWGLYAGFLLGRAGEIVWDERGGWAAAVLFAAALLASVVGRMLSRPQEVSAPGPRVDPVSDAAPVSDRAAGPSRVRS
ncbi:hypothetical protein GCM10012275_61050 [Longimycelium tulufanense]|uniref:Uncharacterized protein n=2 Tax=Longimycelium tulufanense TaxID=907463 RepID=A0A8J3CIH2_9PSEU|nr:hypothetical protein GCM10012275_61050 [Longimycelium tulufanense]